MHRLGFTVLFVASALAGLTLLAASGAQAQAVVINDDGCTLFDGDGNFVLASSDHQVITNNSNGNCLVKCSVKKVANSTGRAVQFDFLSNSIPCNTPCGPTTHWHETVSATGNATLTCHLP
jgi:hypothetical protein